MFAALPAPLTSGCTGRQSLFLVSNPLRHELKTPLGDRRDDCCSLCVRFSLPWSMGPDVRRGRVPFRLGLGAPYSPFVRLHKDRSRFFWGARARFIEQELSWARSLRH